jgi:hypothetical protein
VTPASNQLGLLSDCLKLQPLMGSVPWNADTDWQALVTLANEHLLGPALHGRLQRRRYAGVPDDVREYLGFLYTLNLKRNRSLRRQALEAIRAFNDQGIEPLLLKGGIVLFERPSLNLGRGMRMMRDLDFLVPHEQLPAAIGVLEKLGYTTLTQYPEGHHAVADFVRPDDAGAVDLHIELVDPSYILPAAEVRDHATPLPASSVRAWIPAPTERVLHHLLHAQVHYLGDFYRGEMKLNQLYEFTALVGRYHRSIDWRMIETRLADHDLLTPLHSYLRMAQHLFGLAWPLRSKVRLRAKVHVARCLLQLRAPKVQSLLLPWANLRRAFVGHRMEALYGKGRSLLLTRLRHAWHLLSKMSPRQVAGKFLRTR